MLPEWGYSTGQTHWDRLGAESFLVASPGDLIMYTQSAEVIHRVTQRREDFPKNTAKYGVLDMFGKSVLTTEGQLWRIHRKVTSASFNEKNAAHTFAEAINQTRGMLDMWFGGAEGKRTGATKTIKTLEHDTMTWALNIIGYVGFGLRLLWPGQTLPKDIDPKLAKYGSLDPPPGHTMTFADSVALTLERIISIMVFPEPLLRAFPPSWASFLLRSVLRTNLIQESSPSSSPGKPTQPSATTSNTWTSSSTTRLKRPEAAPRPEKAWTSWASSSSPNTAPSPPTTPSSPPTQTSSATPSS
jgi:hypothetical protein